MLQSLWRSIVLPALTRPIMRMRNCGNILLIAAACLGMTRIWWMSGNATFVQWLSGYGKVKGREERKLDQLMLSIHCTPWTAGLRDGVNSCPNGFGQCSIMSRSTRSIHIEPRISTHGKSEFSTFYSEIPCSGYAPSTAVHWMLYLSHKIHNCGHSIRIMKPSFIISLDSNHFLTMA